VIPPVFHFVWVGAPMPDRLARYIASWAAVHPDWTVKVWGDNDFGWLANQDLYDRAGSHTSSVGQFRSDVARLEILHRFGGVYVDCDFEALQPIDDLCDVPAFAAWEADGVWVNNALMGSVPGHPLWSELIAALPGNVDRCAGKRPNVMTGPQFITPHIVERPDVALYPSAWFYPYLWSELHRQGEEFPEARAVHHWDNARKRKGLVDA
jgi:mannosyltransferase OCH1-like enzyme